MATPRAVSKGLRDTARKIQRVRVDVVADAAERAVSEAIARGGRFRGYPLRAEVTKVSNRGTVSTATVEGVPSGFWVMKTYGRRGGYTVRGTPLNLRFAGTATSAAQSVEIRSATRGDGRWDQVIDAVAEYVDTSAVELIGAAVDG